MKAIVAMLRTISGQGWGIWNPQPWGVWSYVFLTAWFAPAAYTAAKPLYRTWHSDWASFIVTLAASYVFLLLALILFAIGRWWLFKMWPRPEPIPAPRRQQQRLARRNRRRGRRHIRTRAAGRH